MIDTVVTIAKSWHIVRLVSAFFYQSDITVTKDSLCLAILTKPPSTEAELCLCLEGFAERALAVLTCPLIISVFGLGSSSLCSY